MAKRSLYLAAYDISSPGRLAKMLDIVKGYATGGQKSAYECYLSMSEKKAMLNAVSSVIDNQQDRFFLLRLDTRCGVHTLGVAVKPSDQQFFYVG